MEYLVALLAVCQIGGEQAVLQDLALPVDCHRRRAYHDEMGGVFGCCQMSHRSDHLEGLAQAHLVAEYHSALSQDEASAEILVGAQRSAQQREIKRLTLDPRDDGRRQPAGHRRPRSAGAGQPFQLCIELRGISLEQLPGLGDADARGRADLFERRSKSRAVADQLEQAPTCRSGSESAL